MSNTIPLPPLSQILPAIAQLDATPAQKAALTEAFAAGRVCVKAISGGFLVQSFTGGNTYVVTDRCSCPCRLPVCKHRLCIAAIEAAHARPAGTVLPPVVETLAWAATLIEGDINFSQDEPTVNVQLKRIGVRRAMGWEDAQIVTVVEFGKPFQLRVMPLDTMPALAPKSKAQADREMAELFN